jgi:pyruvate formate lyase activating enzyme
MPLRSDPPLKQPPGTLATETGAALLDRHTAEGKLWRAEGDRIRCLACGHRCLLAEGRRGVCKVRFNAQGRLRVPFGYVAGAQCDPVEKKPFFHVHPGSDALTFGMLGCDFHCPYCQNWVMSQALREPASAVRIQPVAAADLVKAAERFGADLMVSSYNEPLITAEWAVSVFQQAREQGLLCAFVSNGNATGEALDFLRPWIAAYKVDLKGFNDQRYRTLGGTLQHVQETIQMVFERGIWLEVLTLLVPGFNDGEDELRALASFVAGVSRDIPWHVTAFHPDYKMTGPRKTVAKDLMRACEIGSEAGLRFVYAGNLPGQVGPWENTRCPKCSLTLVQREGYLVRDYRMTAGGFCPDCGEKIPGLWAQPGRARAGHFLGHGYARQPRPFRLN